ncbi:retrovirus-related pol polyprotein from transposon TNT 1-94 [Tanacetum coccineum]
MKIEESLNVTFDETPPPSQTSPLVDDDIDEVEAVKITEKKNLENVIEDEILEINEIVNVKEFRNHPLENVIGNLNQRTLRLVAQDYNQQEGIDYNETYAPVARLESIRILLAYACALDFKQFQMDVKNAFLNGLINEEAHTCSTLKYSYKTDHEVSFMKFTGIGTDDFLKDRKIIPIRYDDDEDDTIEITPVLPVVEPENSLSMEDEPSDIIPEMESDELIMSSVENLVLIPSEFENDNECDFPECEFSNINIPEEESVTFSNHLFDSNDDYISRDVNLLFDEVLEDIENKDSYDSDLDDTSVLPTEEPENSLIMGTEKLNTILEKESDEFIKSSMIKDQNSIHHLSGDPSRSFNHVIEYLSPSLTPTRDNDYIIEETDTFLPHHDSTKPEVDEEMFDPDGDIVLLERLLNLDSIYLPPHELNEIFDPEADILFLENLFKNYPSEAKNFEIDLLIKGPSDTFLMGDKTRHGGVGGESVDSGGLDGCATKPVVVVVWMLHPLVCKIRDSFNLSFQAWYLDDGTINGDTLIVGEVLKVIMEDGSCRGGPASADFDFSSELASDEGNRGPTGLWSNGMEVLPSSAMSQVRALSRAIGVSSHVCKGKGVIAYWVGPNLVVMGLEKTLSPKDLNTLRNSILCTLARYREVNDVFQVYGEIKKSQQPLMQKTIKTLILHTQDPDRVVNLLDELIQNEDRDLCFASLILRYVENRKTIHVANLALQRVKSWPVNNRWMMANIFDEEKWESTPPEKSYDTCLLSPMKLPRFAAVLEDVPAIWLALLHSQLSEHVQGSDGLWGGESHKPCDVDQHIYLIRKTCDDIKYIQYP